MHHSLQHVECTDSIIMLVNIEFRVPYSQRYLFNVIPNTNHNANPTNPNRTQCFAELKPAVGVDEVDGAAGAVFLRTPVLNKAPTSQG